MTSADRRCDQVLHLIGGPYVSTRLGEISVPEGSKRLVAYLALRGPVVDRRAAAEAIWPDVGSCRASGNLRSALWRLRCAGIDVLDTAGQTLFLRAEVRIDLMRIREWANRVVGGVLMPTDLGVLPLVVQLLDVLPGCYDDWIEVARDELRAEMLDALDALAYRLVEAGYTGDAVEASLAAVGADPLRESSQRALITAHLAEGNRGEAWRSYETYECLLARELGVRPDPGLTDLLRYVAPRRPRLSALTPRITGNRDQLSLGKKRVLAEATR